MCKNLKSTDFEEGSAPDSNDSVNDFGDDSMDDFEDDDDEEEMVEEEEEDSAWTAEKNKEALNALAKSFMGSGVNPNVVKSPSFAKMMLYGNPDFTFSVPLVEKEILEIHQEYKEKAKKFLKDFEGKFTLSYEWLCLGNDWNRAYVKGPVLHEDFVCLTAHFIDDNWKVKKWILGYTTTDFSEIPTEDITIYPFRDAVQEFEIGNKVSTLLLPNEEDFDEETLAPFRKLVQEREDNPINPPVFLLYCCADLFRLMVDDVYSNLSGSLLENLRMLVSWGRCSSSNWNVTLSNLQQGVDLKAEDAFSQDEIYDGYDQPSDEEWIMIQTFCKLTGCIYKVAKELFEEEYSTSNVYFHLLAELKLMLNQELANADGNDYFLRKAQKLLTRFDKYWNDMFLILATASVLDPRFKTKYLEFYCSKKNVNEEGSKVETVLDYLRSLYARYAASEVLSKPICPDATMDAEDAEDDDEEGEEDEDYYTEEEKKEREAEKERKKNKPDVYKDFVLFQEYLKFEGSSREFQESELDAYLKEPVMEWSKDFKALEYWKEESQKYPILSRIARDILSIPISRATWFDAYVPDRKEPPEFTVSMDAKVANAMMCGKSWLHL